jgi:hypothetical protein
MKTKLIFSANFLGALLAICVSVCAQDARSSGSRNGPPRISRKHYVFAHYMVCFAAQGERGEDYKREIQQAQAAGIAGFALNCGAL